jgi:CheY-like chemotaxis protein
MINRNGPYDVYFVDWKMPGMDGIEFSRRIKEQSAEHASVVIMISAVDWGVVEAEARKAGVNKFLSKPLFVSSIADCINEALGVSTLTAAEENRPEEKNCFEGCRILLAEDVEINREIVHSLLEPTALAIDYAENGVEAVRIFSADPDKYDMIFMDVQMPEMDGYEATRHIRALGTPKALSIPILAMTANVFREDIEKCLAAGMNGHIGKPIDFEDMLAKLRKYLLGQGNDRVFA